LKRKKDPAPAGGITSGGENPQQKERKGKKTFVCLRKKRKPDRKRKEGGKGRLTSARGTLGVRKATDYDRENSKKRDMISSMESESTERKGDRDLYYLGRRGSERRLGAKRVAREGS